MAMPITMKRTIRPITDAIRRHLGRTGRTELSWDTRRLGRTSDSSSWLHAKKHNGCYLVADLRAYTVPGNVVQDTGAESHGILSIYTLKQDFRVENTPTIRAYSFSLISLLFYTATTSSGSKFSKAFLIFLHLFLTRFKCFHTFHTIQYTFTPVAKIHKMNKIEVNTHKMTW